MLIRIENLSVSYGSIKALKNISMEIKEGEIVTLIGANGAGKSTLLKSISGLIKPIEGQILYNELKISGLPAYKIARMKIAHVPEGRMIFPGLTTEENLKMGAYSRTDKKEIMKSMETIFALFPRLKGRLSQNAGTLSGGEQQMLAVARGLLLNPKILLLDEPSLGLAPIIVEQVFDAIKEINKKGTTILLVEQNCFLALEVASRGYVIELGKIIKQGDTDILKNDPIIKKSYLGVA